MKVRALVRRSALPFPPEPEAVLQRKIIELARLLGWRVFHPYLSIRSPSGWPDLAMVRGQRLIFSEIKSARGVVTPDQQAWLDDLRRIPGAEVFTWRPADWPQIAEVLR